MNEKTPTYEEFAQEVKKHFLSCIELTEKEADKYLAGEEATREIKRQYGEDVEAYEAGKITRRVFMVGGASSVGYCLSLMYE